MRMGRFQRLIALVFFVIPAAHAGIVEVAPSIDGSGLARITFNLAELPVASGEITIPPDVVQLAGWTSNADGSVSMAVNTAEEVSAGLSQPLAESVTATIEATAEEIGTAGAEWCFAAPEVCLAAVGVAGIVGGFVNPKVTSCTQFTWCKTLNSSTYQYYSQAIGGPFSDPSSLCTTVAHNDFGPNYSGYLGTTTTLSNGNTQTPCLINLGGSPDPIDVETGIPTSQSSTTIAATENDWRDAYFAEMQSQTQPSAQATVLPQALSAAAQPIQVAQTAPAMLTATPAQQTVSLGSSATTNADGTTTTQQQTATLYMNCSGTTVASAQCAPSTTEQTTTSSAQGTTTTTQTQGQEQQATQQCGLAGQAACLVVEPSTYTAPSLATPSTFAASTQMFMARVQAAPLLSGISSLSFPTGGTCPTFALNAWFINGTIDAQCGIFEDIRPELTGICFAVFCIVAIRVFMSA